MATSPSVISEPAPFVVAVRDWIQRELPHIQIPDDITLGDILTGNAVPIFEHLVARVVAPKRAVQLRSSMLLENEHLWSEEKTHKNANGNGNAAPANSNTNSNDNELKKMEQLEKEAEEYEKEIEVLRARLTKASRKQQRKGRFGVDEPQLREALVDAYVQDIDAGVTICEKYGEVLRSKAKPHASSSTSSQMDAEKVVLELRKIGDDARAIMGINTVEKVGVDYAKLRVTKLNADIEDLCKRYKLEDVSNAIQKIAAEPSAANPSSPSKLGTAPTATTKLNADDKNSQLADSAEAFAKRISDKLQDDYLRLFAESEKLPEIADTTYVERKPRVDILDDDDQKEGESKDQSLENARTALKELDKTLSELTTGSRARISRCVRETKELDSKDLAPLQTLLERAHVAQKVRGDSDIKGLVSAKLKALDLNGVETSECDLGVHTLEVNLMQQVHNTKHAAEKGYHTKNMQRLAARAKREEESREEIEEIASSKLVPLLEKALSAALHAKDKTVPSAGAEVDLAAKVDAFIAARVSSPQNSGNNGAKAKENSFGSMGGSSLQNYL